MFKNIFILLILTFSTGLLGKPKLGIIEFETQSKEIKEISSSLYQYLRTQITKNVSNIYDITPASKMNLQDMYLMLGCSEADEVCMKSTAQMLTVDFLVYGSIKSEREKYELTLHLLDVSTGTVKKGRLIGEVISIEDMKKNIDKALNKMFDIKSFVEQPVILIKVDVKNTMADVLIDGKNYGKSPLALTNEDITTGEHEILLKKENYEDYKQIVNLTKTKRELISIEMKPLNKNIAALKKDTDTIDDKKLDVKEDTNLIKKDDTNTAITSNEWYKQWWVWTAAGGVLALTITTIVLINSEESTTPTESNNVIITF